MVTFTKEQMAEARRQMIKATAVLTYKAHHTQGLTARNVLFHAEELMKSLDALHAGRTSQEIRLYQSDE